MRLVVKRITPRWLDALRAGHKPWELRRGDDWDWAPGDALVLAEWLASTGYSGAWALVLVVTVTEADAVPGGLAPDYVLLTITPILTEGWCAPPPMPGSDAAWRSAFRAAARAFLSGDAPGPASPAADGGMLSVAGGPPARRGGAEAHAHGDGRPPHV